MSEIYSPQEDSYLISSVLKKEIPKIKYLEKIKFLEVGSGSGINLMTAKSCGLKKENIFSVDVNPEAVSKCKSLGFNCVNSNLFERLSKKQKYKLIIFNPPYLPEDKTGFENKESKLATTGGLKGNEIILKFLEQAKLFLSEKGKIFLLTSSHTPKINFKKYGYNSEIIEEKSLFFEKIFVWNLEPI